MERDAETPALRICVFTSAHGPTDSRVVQREATTLADAGYDVTYYTPFKGECPVDFVAYGDISAGELPDVSDRLAWAGTVARILVETDYDVYHFHDVELLPVGVLLKYLTDGSVIYDVHENVEDVLRQKPLLPKPVRPYLATMVSKIELGLARFVDSIVVASPDIAERFDGFDDVTIVTNYPKRRWAEETNLGGDSSETTIDIDEETASYFRDDENPIRFIYRGLLSQDRGIHTLIEAIDRVPEDYDVSLVLGGKYESKTERERIEARMAASDRVEFVEWLPTLDDMMDLFRWCDVGVICFHPAPNKNEAVHRSNKLFQYMAAGLPIIVSDVGNWSELVTDIGCGVAVDPESPEAIADAMTTLVENPEERQSFARRGHEAALERFNWETQREKLLDVYRRSTEEESGEESGTSHSDQSDSETLAHSVD